MPLRATPPTSTSTAPTSASHLAFGFGTHHCLGAPLARRELTIGFRALVDRVETLSFVEGANDFRHQPNFVLRALEHLHLELTPR